MKITKKDTDVFRMLSHGELGQHLVDYMRRLSDNICDSRNWTQEDTKESTRIAAAYIKKYLIDKITLQTQATSHTLNDFE